MNLIDDVDFEFPARSEADIFAKFPNLVHAIVAGPINLKHVKANPLRDLSTRIANSARVDRRSLEAVDGFGQNAGGRGFAGTAWADEKIGMSQTLLLNGILQRPNHMILAQHIVENLGAIFSRKNLVTHKDNLVSRRRNSIPFVR